MPFNDATNFEQDLTVFDRIRSRESQQLLHKVGKIDPIKKTHNLLFSQIKLRRFLTN